MEDLRSFFRRSISGGKQIRVLSRNGTDLVGNLLDVSQKGFRLNVKKTLAPGTEMGMLIEYTDEQSGPHLIPITAQCMWNHRKECGFSIKEIPQAEESHFDRLIETFKGGA